MTDDVGIEVDFELVLPLAEKHFAPMDQGKTKSLKKKTLVGLKVWYSGIVTLLPLVCL